MKYRADIDGLRAIAVLMVVIYHAGFSFLSGGFVGVDVFFVISGFLITKIIYKDVLSETFSFKSFYTKRFKRILPAYIVIGFFTLFVSFFVLLPSDFIDLHKSFLSASLFSSNIFFWRDSAGYFGNHTEQMPLLHTWSLSVEEQFYVIWPPVLIMAHNWISKKRLTALIALTIIISFSAAQWGAINKPGPTFYLLPTRIGELSIGGLLAILPNYRLPLSRFIINLLSLTGLILILVPAFILNGQSTFPGLNAIAPCLGAALIIKTGDGEDTITSRILSIKPLIFIGLISYSMYLWHWPPIALLHYQQIEITPTIGTALIIISGLLAYFSWKFIEQPFRHGQYKSFLVVTIKFFIVPTAIISVLTLIAIKQNGYYSRFNKAQQFAIQFHESHNQIEDECIVAPLKIQDIIAKCTFGAQKKDVDILLAGDSHAMSLTGFMESLALDAKLKMVTLTRAGSPILLGIDKIVHNNHELRTDISLFNDTFQQFLNKYKFKYVALTARYSQYIYGVRIKNGNKNVYLQEKLNQEISIPNSEESFRKSMMKNVKAIVDSGAIPILIEDVPEYEIDLSKCSILTNYENCYIPLKYVKKRQGIIRKTFLNIKNLYPQTILIDPKDIICSQSKCFTGNNKYPFYRDTDHLSYLASREIGKEYILKNQNPLINLLEPR